MVAPKPDADDPAKRLGVRVRQPEMFNNVKLLHRPAKTEASAIVEICGGKIWAENRPGWLQGSPELIAEVGSTPGFGIAFRFRHFIDGSLALVSLSLTRRDIVLTLTATLTTIAFDDSSLQRFEACT